MSSGGFKWLTLGLVVALGVSSGVYAFQPLFDPSHPDYKPTSLTTIKKTDEDLSNTTRSNESQSTPLN